MRFETEYNVQNAPQDSAYGPVPAGDYVATIEKAEIKNTKAGTGSYLNLQLKLQNGRVVFGTITLRNQSKAAEDIGKVQMGQLQVAAGIPLLTDTDQLIGSSVLVHITIRQQAGYEDSNNVGKYRAVGNAVGNNHPASVQPQHPPRQPVAPPSQQQPTAPATATRPAGSATPPWKR